MTIQDAAITRHNGAPPAPPATTGMSGFLAQGAAFMQLASDLAKSDIIPKDFRNKPANCFLALEMANRLNLGAMEVMQNLYVVHGTPSLSSKFLIGLANRSGRFRGGLRFDVNGQGKDMSVRCYAKDRETGEVLEVIVTMAQAVQAGWTKNAKYKEMGEQMCSYRAATFFVRRYCPEVMLGMMTVEEAHEMPRDVPTETASDPLDALMAPLDTPDETAKAMKDAVHTDAAEAQQETPQFAPPEVVAKLVASFEGLGVSEEELAASFGPLDKMTKRTFDEAREFGKQKTAAKAKAEAEAAANEPPADELFTQGEQASGYGEDA